MTVLPFRNAADVDSALPAVASHIANGGLLAYPTETVYGMGSRMKGGDLAVLAALTARPADKPFLMLVSGEAMIRDCGLAFNETAALLAARFWPGPLTLVVDRLDPAFPETLGDRSSGVAVRWSSHQETSRLIEAMGIPISSTSANISGREPLQTVDEIATVFEAAVCQESLLLLDGGVLSGGLPSTLVDCRSSEPILLRQGVIRQNDIMLCVEEGTI